MSYEGEEEFLCGNGHYHVMGCNEMHPETCQLQGCSERMVWHHSIDHTNGYMEDEPDTYGALCEEIGFSDALHVDHYGNKYFTQSVRFKPAKGSAWSLLPTPEEKAAWKTEWERLHPDIPY